MSQTVRKTIIYFGVAVFLFAGLSAVGLAVFLHRGIQIENFSWKRVQLENCYIVWDNKVRISIETITITPDDADNSWSPGVTDVRGFLTAGKYAGPFIAEVGVEHLKSRKFSGALNYTGWSDEAPGTIHLSSTDINLDATVQHDGTDFVIGINNLSSNSYRSAITGRVRITKEPLVRGKLLANIAGKLPLSLTIAADDKGFSFASDTTVTIDSINPVTALFKLSPGISPWITEYLKGSSYQLILLEGTLLWDDPASFLDNVHAKVRIQDCAYTFAQGLDAIKSEYTDVVFEKRVLNIYPHNARFYNQDCEKSWVKIDFTEPIEPILTAYIDTHAIVNDDIINLLSYYGIALPVKQLEGKTAADLVLEITLPTIDVDVTATFNVDQGVFVYKGMPLEISECIVLLKNTDVTIQHMLVTYPEVFSGKVNGHISFSQRYGDITIIALESRFKTDDSEIRLHNGSEILSYIYHIRPEGDSIESTASTWQFDSSIFHLAPFSAPFDPHSQIISLPPTPIKTTVSQSEAMISGEINIKSRAIDLLLDFKSYRRGNLELAQPSWKLGIQIKNDLKILQRETSKWLINNIATTLSPNEIHYKNDELTIQNGHLTFGDFLEGSVDGSFNFEIRKGSFVLSKLHWKNDTIGTLLRDYDGFEVIVSGDDTGIEFDIPLLDVKIESGQDKSGLVTFRDLGKLVGRFPFLKRYHLSDGKISFGSKNWKKPYHFQGEITYPYSIFVVGGIPVNHYDFSGTIGEDGVRAQVLKKLRVRIDEKITLTSNNLEYNILEIVKLLKDVSHKKGDSSMDAPSKHLELMAKKSSLYFRPESRVLADKLQMYFEDGKTSLWLEHESGSAAFTAEDGAFSLEGDNLDDSFMEALLAGSDFEGGSLSFRGSGEADNFDAHFKVQNTILENYGVLNNVLAFVNTIPALITFSVPDYNAKGLVVESALLDLSYGDNLYTVNSFDVNSNALTVRGIGNASMLEDTIDLKLNLITEGREDLSKIPLVGYILVGDEKVPSITLEVTGKISDPDIKNSAFEEIVTLPFDMGLRALMSPFKWLESLFSSEDSSTKSNNVGKKQGE